MVVLNFSYCIFYTPQNEISKWKASNSDREPTEKDIETTCTKKKKIKSENFLAFFYPFVYNRTGRLLTLIQRFWQMLSGNISLRLGDYAANLPWSYNTKLYLVL